MRDYPEARKRLLYDAEIALAMELRTQGISWKLIAYGLGVSDDTIRKRVTQAKAEGMTRSST